MILAKPNCSLTRLTLPVTNSSLASARFGKRKVVAKLVCITSSALGLRSPSRRRFRPMWARHLRGWSTGTSRDDSWRSTSSTVPLGGRFGMFMPLMTRRRTSSSSAILRQMHKRSNLTPLLEASTVPCSGGRTWTSSSWTCISN